MRVSKLSGELALLEPLVPSDFAQLLEEPDSVQYCLTVGLPFPRGMLPFPENFLFQNELLQVQPVEVPLVEALNWSCS